MRKKISNTSEYIATDLRLLFLAKQKISPGAPRVIKSPEKEKQISKDKGEKDRGEEDISDIVIT